MAPTSRESVPDPRRVENISPNQQSTAQPSKDASKPTIRTSLSRKSSTTASDSRVEGESLRPNPKFTVTGTVLRTGTMDNTVLVTRNTVAYNEHLHNRYIKPVREKVHDPLNVLKEGDVITYGLFPNWMWEKRKEEGRLGGTRNKRGVRYILGKIVSPFGAEETESRVAKALEDLKSREEKGRRVNESKLVQHGVVIADHEVQRLAKEEAKRRMEEGFKTRLAADPKARARMMEGEREERKQKKIQEWVERLRKGTSDSAPFPSGEEIHTRDISLPHPYLAIYIMGLQGERIKEIRQSSGARVVAFNNLPGSEAKAMAMGSNGAVEKALSLIQVEVEAGKKWIEERDAKGLPYAE